MQVSYEQGIKGEAGMDTIKWEERYNIQVPAIDAQHKRLVELVNHLIVIQDQKTSDDDMARILGAMTSYLGEHFDTEEQMMIDHDYPARGSHREEHQAFVTRTAYYIAIYQKSGELPTKDLLHFLRTWLVDHIGKTDAAFGAFLRADGPR
jgi:hemerythrin-like metal-binding protein